MSYKCVAKATVELKHKYNFPQNTAGNDEQIFINRPVLRAALVASPGVRRGESPKMKTCIIVVTPSATQPSSGAITLSLQL